MFICWANYDEDDYGTSQACTWDYFFLTHSLIGSKNDQISHLTNQQVVLIELNPWIILAVYKFNYCKPLMSFTIHHVSHCVACKKTVIGCWCDLLLERMNLHAIVHVVSSDSMKHTHPDSNWVQHDFWWLQ